MIALYKQEPGSFARYYSIARRGVQDEVLQIVWGTSNSRPRERAIAFDTADLLQEHLRRAVSKRLQSGYRVLYTFFRADEYGALSQALTL